MERKVQIYVDTVNPNQICGCDTISVTYTLIGEEPVTVEVDFDYINNGKNLYKFSISDLDFSIVWNGINWILSNDTEETIEATLSEDTECPFGTYTIEEGSIFEAFEITSACPEYNYQELELFNDETIEVTSTIQNIADISKVFTDVSLSFSVPASRNNNAIFQHFYNSEVDSTVDHSIKRNAYIEIDLTPFRTGKISLEKSNVKKGVADNYQITFYGDLLSLKDKFGEDKLSDVKELNNYSHVYNATEIYNRITDDSIFYDVRYPLISWKNLWQYNTGGGTYDITQNAHPIFFSELFPALSVRRIMNAIGAKYGVTFSGTWMSDQRFIKCFLLLKNVLGKVFVTEPLQVQILSYSTGGGDYFDTTNNTLNYSYLEILAGQVIIPNSLFHVTKITIASVSSATVTMYIDVFINGTYSNTITRVGNAAATYTVLNQQNVDGLNSVVIVKVRASENITYNANMTYEQTYNVIVSGTVSTNTTTYTTTSANQTFSGNVDLATLAPEIKVADFVSGIIKEFNLTCFGTSVNNFTLQPLDEWYNSGAIVDITKYTDIDSIDVDRIKLYKKISFKYLESESFMNKNFKSLYFRDYGNTNSSFDYDGGEYSVEVPFENLMFQKFTGTQLQVGYHLNETFQSYVPKPTLLYMYDQKPCSFKFWNGTTHVTVTEYMPFGQDAIIEGVNHSLNFSADQSTLLNVPISNSLFAEYYFGYLTNLYNIKNRLIHVKTNLPISLLTNLNLNDRLIIRDKRYVINEMKSNLRTGDVDFSLYLDFRPVNPPSINTVSSLAACYSYLINIERNSFADLTSSLAGVTITPNRLTTSGFVTICLPANTTGIERTITITITTNNRDGNSRINYLYIIQQA
jgi:hypothetical protein